MGAFYLKTLDERVEKLGLTCVRFMDDWVILAPSRWKLRAAVKVVNQTLKELNLEKHPGKTFIGKICRGFDFLGFTFSPSGIGVACQTIGRFADHLSLLYEQGADTISIGAYVQRWMRWVRSAMEMWGVWLRCLIAIYRNMDPAAVAVNHEWVFHLYFPTTTARLLPG